MNHKTEIYVHFWRHSIACFENCYLAKKLNLDPIKFVHLIYFELAHQTCVESQSQSSGVVGHLLSVRTLYKTKTIPHNRCQQIYSMCNSSSGKVATEQTSSCISLCSISYETKSLNPLVLCV